MTISAADAPVREEQYRAKYGRFAPAYESQLKAVPAVELTDPSTLVCCSSLRPAPHHKIESTNAIRDEERNRVRYDRYLSAKEAQVKAAKDDLAIYALACRKLNQCPLAVDKHSPVGQLSSNDARSLTKYGRTFENSQSAISNSESRSPEPCEHVL